MAQETTVAVKINASTGGTESVKSLKTQIIEATNEATRLAEEFGKFSPQAIEAAKKAAELKQKIGDVQKTISGLGANKFEKIANVATTVAGGIQAAQGAMALFGAESENAQKALLKVQGAIALSQGINQIMQLETAFAGLATMATTTFATIKAAIISSGVGGIVLLVAGLAAAAIAFTKTKVKAFELNQTLKNQSAIKTSLIEIEKESAKVIENTYGKTLALISVIKDQNQTTKSRSIALKELQKEYPDYLKNINLEKVSTEELRKQTDTLTDSIYKRAKAEAAMTELTKIAGKEFELRQKIANLDKQAIEQTKEISETRAKYGTTIAETTKGVLKGQKSFADQAKTTRQELESLIASKDTVLQLIKETGAIEIPNAGQSVVNSAAEQTRDLEQERLERQAKLLAIDQDTYDKQIAAADAEFLTTIKDLKEQGFTEIEIGILRDANLEKIRQDYFKKKKEDELKDAEESKKRLEEQAAYRDKINQNMLSASETYYQAEKLKAIQNITDKTALAKKLQDLELEQLQTNLDAMTALKGENSSEAIAAELALAQKKKEIGDKEVEENKAREDKKAADEKAAMEQRYSLAASGFGQIADLADAFAGKSEAQQRKAFEIRKKAAMAQAIIETIAAAQSAYNSQLSIPTLDAPVRAAIAAAAAIAAGIARVRKIDTTPFEAKGISGEKGGGGVQPPITTPLTGGTLPDTEAGQFAGMGKVYVLEGDITKTQTRVRRVRNVSVV